MKNKKAISADVFSWLPKSLLLAAAILVFLTLIHMYVVTQIDTKEAEAAILINRILFSPNGISYFDEEISRTYPGTVDLEKFDDSILEQSIDLPENRIVAAKLTLFDLNKEELKTIHFNQIWYDRWKQRTRIGGPGGTTKIDKEVYVLLKEDNETKKAILKFEVIIPNT